MATRFVRLFACLIFLGSLFPAARAEENYSYELDAKGIPVFSQVLSWESVEGSGGYTLEIQDDNSAVVVSDFDKTTERTVHLGAGRYRYRVTVYNILGNPEIAGDWDELVVQKAERPAIESVSPRVLYLDSSSLSFEVFGENIFGGSSVALVRAAGGEELAGVASSIAGDGSLAVVLSRDFAAPGEYRVRVRNPGGLFADDTSIFRIVQARQTYCFALALGWCPWVPLYDSWYTGIWNRGMYLPGLAPHLYWSVSDERMLSFGARATCAFHWFDTSSGDMVISTDCRRIEAACFAQYRLTPVFHILVGAGGGIALTYAKISYETGGSGDVGTIDPSLNAFLEFRYAAGRHSFAGVGAEFLNVFYSGKSVGVLIPEIFAGWKF